MTSWRVIDPSAYDGDVYQLLGSLVVPRPIAWVSTRSSAGVDNIAPHSFFQLVSTQPPVVMVSSMGEKDTVRNARASGEFVVCGSPGELIDEINLTSVPFGPDDSEFDRVGLVREASEVVAAPRVAGAPYALECQLVQEISMGNAIMLFGEVLRVVIDETILSNGRADIRGLNPVARLGGSDWGLVGEVITRERPSLEQFLAAQPAASGMKGKGQRA